jgi:hypothetical protein
MNYSVPGGLRRSILEKLGFSGSAGGAASVGVAQGLAFSCCPAATKNILENDGVKSRQVFIPMA